MAETKERTRKRSTARRGSTRRRSASSGLVNALEGLASNFARREMSDGVVFREHGDAIVEIVVTYSDAAERSRDTGRHTQFLVDVAPSGSPVITEVKEPVFVVEALNNGGRHSELDDALVAARARGRERIAEILARPEMLSAAELGKRIGASRMTINTKRQRRQLLALEGATRGFRFPNWQIGEDGKPFKALPQLFDKLGDRPWAIYRFLLQHHPELDGRTALEALAAGDSDKVVEAADSVAQSFA